MNMTHHCQYLPRKYAEVNLVMSRDDDDDDHYEWNRQDQYQIINKIGSGKYSEVYEGIQNSTGTRMIIKILKPIRQTKINREIKILQTLQNGSNIISLLDIVKDASGSRSGLVFEYLHNRDFRYLIP